MVVYVFGNFFIFLVAGGPVKEITYIGGGTVIFVADICGGNVVERKKLLMEAGIWERKESNVLVNLVEM